MNTLAERPADAGPVAMIREAMASGKSPEYLREILNVRREWEADEARKAFNQAISEFQRRAPIVEKGDTAYDKPYARMDRIWRTIRPLLTELGLSVTWQTCTLVEAGELCHVEGMLRHRDGHGEKLIRDVPMPEILKGQNKSQRAGSASSYATRYALCGALGVVTGDDFDDDGNGGVKQVIDGKEQKEILALVDACRGLSGFNEEVFWRFVGSKDLGKLPVSRLPDVLDLLNRRLGKIK